MIDRESRCNIERDVSLHHKSSDIDVIHSQVGISIRVFSLHLLLFFHSSTCCVLHFLLAVSCVFFHVSSWLCPLSFSRICYYITTGPNRSEVFDSLSLFYFCSMRCHSLSFSPLSMPLLCLTQLQTYMTTNSQPSHQSHIVLFHFGSRLSPGD